MDLIFLLSPTSGADRVRLVAQSGQGFVYYVSVTGVTGTRRALDAHLRGQIARVRRATSLPIGVGFGISTPKQAAWIASRVSNQWVRRLAYPPISFSQVLLLMTAIV